MMLSSFRKGAALVALFSALPAHAADWPHDHADTLEIRRGNAQQPHQPPAWFSRLASPPVRGQESPIFELPVIRLHLGKVFAPDGSYYCFKVFPDGLEKVSKCFD